MKPATRFSSHSNRIARFRVGLDGGASSRSPRPPIPRHIVHFEKIRLFNAVNLERGYKPLQIYSPREVTHYGED